MYTKNTNILWSAKCLRLVLIRIAESLNSVTTKEIPLNQKLKFTEVYSLPPLDDFFDELFSLQLFCREPKEQNKEVQVLGK